MGHSQDLSLPPRQSTLIVTQPGPDPPLALLDPDRVAGKDWLLNEHRFAAQLDAAPPLPPMPAVVLSADKPFRTDLLPAEVAAVPTVTFAQWLAAQDLLARQLGAAHVTATDSGHNIYLYHPALVTDQVRQIVDDVRSPAS